MAAVIDRDRRGEAIRAGVVRRDEILAAVLDPFDRPPEPARHKDDADLVAGHEELLPEAATDVLLRDPNMVLGEAEDATAGQAHLMGVLAGHPYLQPLVGRVELGDDAPRFHRDVGLPVLVKRL